jgi:hypothetical protein
MLAPIYAAIEAILDADDTLSEQDKDTILAACKHPDRFASQAREPLPRLLTIAEVAAILNVNKCTVWRMVKSGALVERRICDRPRYLLQDVLGMIQPSKGMAGRFDASASRSLP